MFSYSHWVSLKRLFWILYEVNSRNPCLWGQLLEDYCDPLVVSCCLDFFTFLEVLHCYLHIWNSNKLLQSLLIAFRREIPSAMLGILGLLTSSMEKPAPRFLLLVAELLSFVCLLLIPQCTRPSADSLPFVFPKVVLKLKFVYSPWPRTCSLAVSQSSLSSLPSEDI